MTGRRKRSIAVMPTEVKRLSVVAGNGPPYQRRTIRLAGQVRSIVSELAGRAAVYVLAALPSTATTAHSNVIRVLVRGKPLARTLMKPVRIGANLWS